jgi:hypothetical protein
VRPAIDGRKCYLAARRVFTAVADTPSTTRICGSNAAGGPRKIVHRGGTYGRYLASGHLAFVHDRASAMPFDLDRLEPPVHRFA